MTVRWTVRAAEPTVAFSPQRKGKTVRFKSHPRNQKDLPELGSGRLFFFTLHFFTLHSQRYLWKKL